MTMDVGVLVRLGDKISGPLRGVTASVTPSAQRMTDRLSKATAGMKEVGRGLAGIAQQTRGVAAGLAAYTGAMAGLAVSFVGPAAQMERFRVQLTSLEGSSAGAEKALAWISDFATRTPLEMNDTIAAYARLKAFGIDPTNGSLQAIVDTMAATGGGVEQLDGLVMALGQSWSKGKLQSEEALQMLERGVPVWDLLAAKMGKSSEEVQALATAGKLGRDEIMLLMQALGEKNAGASEGMSKTWDGVISNLMDHWSRFQLMVMGSGVFESLKAKLQAFLELLNQMAADGRLQAWADLLATKMLGAIEGLWGFGQAMVETWKSVAPWVEAGASAVGGWENFLMIIGAGACAGKIAAIGGAIVTVGKGLIMLARLAMGHPIIAAIALIAAGAVMIYRNWDAIAAWFSALWSSVVGAFKAAWAWITSAVDRLTPAPIKAAWSILTAYFTGVFDGVMQVFRGVVDFVAGVFTGDMDRATSGLRQIWEGFKTYITAIFTAVGDAIKLVWTSAIKPIFDKLGLTEGIGAAWGALKAAFDLHLNAISAMFSFVWDNAIKPRIDGLQSVGGVGAVWESMKEAMASVMDWLGTKFDWLWQKVSPVMDALRWVQGKGAAALQSLGLSGGDAGPGDMPASDGMGNVPGYAKGGSFGKGPIIVGEEGDELRYENRGGYIAHHRALKEMARLSRMATPSAGVNVAHSLTDMARFSRVAAAQDGSPATGLQDEMARLSRMVATQRMGPVDPAAFGRTAAREVTFAPNYNLTVNTGSGDVREITAAVRRELAVNAARMKVEARGYLND